MAENNKEEDSSDYVWWEEDSGPEIEPFNVADRGVTVEQFVVEQSTDFEAKYAWTELLHPENANATIGVAVDRGWEFAKKEFYFIRSKLEGVCGEKRPKIEKIFDFILGRESAVYRVFEEEKIFVSHDDFLQFTATYLHSSTYQVSCKQMFDKHDRINMEGCMGKADYLAAWHRIGDASLPMPYTHFEPLTLLAFQ